MSVKLDELPNCSQLIIGLNPPFGAKASVANRFIRKALKFRPKLLILIVPRETKRRVLVVDFSPLSLCLSRSLSYFFSALPDSTKSDSQVIVAGKSFYLPGSVDMHYKRLADWNLKAPPLYLWSRRDRSVKSQGDS